jgi:hypothetical protein
LLAGRGRSAGAAAAPPAAPSAAVAAAARPPVVASAAAAGAPPSSAGFFGRFTCASTRVASIIVPARRISPRASICRVTSANTRSASPCSTRAARKRQIVEWSGAVSSSASPTKRRKESRSVSASSSPGAESAYHCCSNSAFSISSGG